MKLKKSFAYTIAAAALMLGSLCPVSRAQSTYPDRYFSGSYGNGFVDNSPVGSVTPSTGAFTALSANSLTGGSVTTNWSQVNGSPTPVGNNGFTGWGKNGTGDFDFFAAHSGSSPSFYWWFLLGSTNTVEMFLDTNANLHVPNGGVTAQSVQALASVTLPSYTVALLPSPVTLGVGGSVVVKDCTSYTPGPLASSCGTGGGSDVMLGISNGTVWTVH